MHDRLQSRSHADIWARADYNNVRIWTCTPVPFPIIFTDTSDSTEFWYIHKDLHKTNKEEIKHYSWFWHLFLTWDIIIIILINFQTFRERNTFYMNHPLWTCAHWNQFLGGLSLHLNHLIASHAANYNWPFGTLPFGLFWSNLDTRDLETYPRTYSGHFWNMSLFDNSRTIWVLFRKWVVSENQSFLDEGVISTPLSV